MWLSPGDYVLGTLLDLIDAGEVLSPREQLFVDFFAAAIDIMAVMSAAELLGLAVLHPAPTFSMLSLGARAHVMSLTSPLFWVAAISIAGTRAQIKSQTEQGSGVRGTGSFGVAPSYHLKGGKPWWASV